MQMLFVAMLIDAFHAALKDGEIAFDSIGVDHIWLPVWKGHSVCIADIFIFAMIDGGMPSEVISSSPLSSATDPSSAWRRKIMHFGPLGRVGLEQISVSTPICT